MTTMNDHPAVKKMRAAPVPERAGILEFLAHVPHKHAEREAYLLWVEMRKREEQEEEGTENGA